MNDTHNCGGPFQLLRTDHLNANSSQYPSFQAYDRTVRRTAANVRLNNQGWLQVPPPSPQPKSVAIHDQPFHNSWKVYRSGQIQEELLSLFWSLGDFHAITTPRSVGLQHRGC